jgi:hypothetical protein
MKIHVAPQPNFQRLLEPGRIPFKPNVLLAPAALPGVQIFEPS